MESSAWMLGSRRARYTGQWFQKKFAAERKQEQCLFWSHRFSQDGSMIKSSLSQWWMEGFYAEVDAYLCMEQMEQYT